jgi:UDP-glucose-4-epimerase GalE
MSARDCILVTGGAGFVGSHFARAAIEAGSRVVILDDLSGSSDWPPLVVASKPQHVAGIPVVRIRGDVADRALVAKLIEEHRITAVVHFAGKICVGESVTDPAAYFDRNVTRSLALLDVVREVGPRVFVLSSTAAIYGSPDRVPIPERAGYAPVNPYGASKLAIEYALASYGRAYGIGWAALRYFNAAGAHPDGTLREAHDPETHLIPLAIDASLGKRPHLAVFGDDYSTKDGTCSRDYVHVCDLAQAHLAAIDMIDRGGWIGAINLGSGRSSTVREVLAAVAAVTGKEVPHFVAARREGDPSTLVADVGMAREVLNWRPARDLGTIVEDAVRSRRDGSS